MSRNITELPFTELVEQAAQIARNDKDNDLSRVRAAVNHVYCREIPKKEDWIFLMTESSLITDPQYTTGTASVNTGASAVTFSSDTVLTAAMTGRKIKFGSNPDVYTVTFSNATGGTITPSLSGIINQTSVPFTIFQDTYPLPTEFDRFVIDGGLFYFQGGRYNVVEEAKSQHEFFQEYVSAPSVPRKCRIVEVGTGNFSSVQVTPPAQNSQAFGYRYVKKLIPMRETTAGFVDISAGGTAVTGSAGTTRFTEATTGWYFRISAFGRGEDSTWHRVSAIANDSSLTLASAFGLSGATTAAYVLAQAPEMPAKIHFAILAGAVKFILADQNSQLFQFYDLKEREEMADAKRLYKTRVYSPKVDSVAEEFHYRR